jgi:hypothetical protein
MNDDYLNQFQRKPPSKFTEALYARLAALPDTELTSVESLKNWLLRRALPSFSVSFLLMAFVAGLLPPLRASLWQLASGRNYEVPAASFMAVPTTLATSDAQLSLPVTLTRIPQWTPAGFVLSTTITAYELLTGTSGAPDTLPMSTSTRVDYTWHDELGRQITLALQPAQGAQPITATSLLQPASIHGYSATLSELTYQPGWLNLTWEVAGTQYSLMAPQDVLSTTLIKMAESIPSL